MVATADHVGRQCSEVSVSACHISIPGEALQPLACNFLLPPSACDVQAAEEASGQPTASVLASTGSSTQSMAMRVAAIVQGSQNGTLDELWQLFCTLQVCPGPQVPRSGASSQACRMTSHDCIRPGVRRNVKSTEPVLGTSYPCAMECRVLAGAV